MPTTRRLRRGFCPGCGSAGRRGTVKRTPARPAPPRRRSAASGLQRDFHVRLGDQLAVDFDVACAPRQRQRHQQRRQELARHVAAHDQRRFGIGCRAGDGCAAADSRAASRTRCARRPDRARRRGRRSAARACAARRAALVAAAARASAAVSGRIAVPALPRKRSACCTGRRPRAAPSIAHRSAPSARHCDAERTQRIQHVPACRRSRAASVERRSRPRASAASSNMRLEMLFEPGRRTVPATRSSARRSR